MDFGLAELIAKIEEHLGLKWAKAFTILVVGLFLLFVGHYAWIWLLRPTIAHFSLKYPEDDTISLIGRGLNILAFIVTFCWVATLVLDTYRSKRAREDTLLKLQETEDRLQRLLGKQKLIDAQLARSEESARQTAELLSASEMTLRDMMETGLASGLLTQESVLTLQSLIDTVAGKRL